MTGLRAETQENDVTGRGLPDSGAAAAAPAFSELDATTVARRRERLRGSGPVWITGCDAAAGRPFRALSNAPGAVLRPPAPAGEDSGMFDGIGGIDGLKNLADKAKDVAEEHGDAIGTGLEKAGDLVDERTDGKYTEQIDTGVSKAQQLVQRLGEQGSEK